MIRLSFIDMLNQRDRGRSILVSALYSSKPSLRDCLLSAIGMLTKRKSAVLARAPRMRYAESGDAQTTERAMPHHIRISPR